MIYNPARHHRRSIRLKGYDYSRAGLYFITICCQDRICRFGEIVRANQNGSPEMILNECGQIGLIEWAKLPERFPNVELDVYQIMPNHIHGIIVLNEIPVGAVGAGFTPAHPAQNQYENIAQNDSDKRATARVAPTVSDIVGAYKSLVANECLKIFKTNNETMGKLWQRNYYERIIRDEKSYLEISDYIIKNPANWDRDSLK
ncbi:MAG TPA: transposase [Bacteroidales bacterium]|nr:transposase [Bacteroidales bacterium]